MECYLARIGTLIGFFGGFFYFDCGLGDRLWRGALLTGSRAEKH
jgi:hypothetical protein